MLRHFPKKLFSTTQHSRVAIIGAGCGGNTLSSQLINSGHFQPGDITIFDQNELHHYQPGYTNIAGGVWTGSAASIVRKVQRDKHDLLHPGINWIKEHVKSIDADNNKIVTSGSETVVSYDYLVVATGIDLRYDLIPGSLQALEDPNCPVGSMYRLDYAKKMSLLRENFKGGRAIFTLPQMPVKCGGAPQKIMYLSEETFRKNGVRDNIDIHFYTSAPSMFPVKKFGDALLPLA